MIVINGFVSNDLKQHLLLGGTHPVARRHANLIIAGGDFSFTLPDGYTQLKYIESSGTQYIDTGFVPNQDTRLVMKTEFKITGSNMFLFGARTSEKENSFAFNAYTSNIYRSHYNTTWLDYDSSVSFSEPFTIDKNKNTTKLNGVHTVTEQYAKFECPCNLTLFALNTKTAAQTFATAKLYDCKIYNNGKLIRDFIPCINSSGNIGLYDAVTKAFYKNSGTGSFIAGK